MFQLLPVITLLFVLPTAANYCECEVQEYSSTDCSGPIYSYSWSQYKLNECYALGVVSFQFSSCSSSSVVHTTWTNPSCSGSGTQQNFTGDGTCNNNGSLPRPSFAVCNVPAPPLPQPPTCNPNTCRLHASNPMHVICMPIIPMHVIPMHVIPIDGSTLRRPMRSWCAGR